jgi:hypothetical protein
MKPRYLRQKFFFGLAIFLGLATVAALGIAALLDTRLPVNAAWALVIVLPVFILGCIGACAAFLVVRMLEGDGLGKGFIAAAAIVLLCFGAATVFQIVRGRAPHDDARQKASRELAKLSTNAVAFFDGVDRLSPFDDRTRSQVESLVAFQGFRNVRTDMVDAYFARATNAIPPGVWIPRHLLFGIPMIAADPDPQRMADLEAVLRTVRVHHAAAFQMRFEHQGRTNNLRGFVEAGATTAPSADRYQTILRLLIDR